MANLDDLRNLPCCGPGCKKQFAGEVHHPTGAGMGRRSHDHLAMPLCRMCQRDFHDARGAFRDWDKARRREWQAEQSKKYGPDVAKTGAQK